MRNEKESPRRNSPVALTQSILGPLSQLQIENTFLSLGIIYQIDPDLRKLGLSMVVIWMTITFLKKTLKTCNNSNRGRETIYGICLGLLLLQARTIIQMQDDNGLTQYLLMGLGIASASTLNKQQWKRLLQWLGMTSIPILALYFTNFTGSIGILPSVLSEPATSIGKALEQTQDLRAYLQETVFSYLTISAFAAGRLSKDIYSKIASYAGMACGLALCVLADSRMAIISPILAVAISLAVCNSKELKKHSKNSQFAFIFTSLAAVAITVFTVVVAPELRGGDGVSLTSDRGRINIAICWASSIFSGNNRFVYGTGHNKEFIMDRCTDAKLGHFWVADPNSTAGHAHNVAAHIIGLHGLFGLIALLILGCIYTKGIIFFAKREMIFSSHPPMKESWTEAMLALGGFMLICSMSTTFFIYNHTLQVLIGLALGMPLCKIESNRSRQVKASES